MSVSLTDLELPDVGSEVLREAVRTALEQQSSDIAAPSVGPRSLSGRLPTTDQLKAGAEASVAEEGEDAAAAQYFQSLLELGYLVASADGLADEEREALADLVEHATGSAVEHDVLTRHFTNLDAAAEMLGRRERMGRIAANFDDFMAREEAMSFAALVAVADGKPRASQRRGRFWSLGNTSIFRTAKSEQWCSKWSRASSSH